MEVISKNKIRDVWIDALKGLAILCVIIGHSIERMQTGTGYINEPLHFIDVFVNRMHIYIFFMVGGYLYARFDRQKIQNYENYTKIYIKKKFYDFMLPYLFFAILVWIGKTIFSAYVVKTVSFADLLLMFVKPVAFLWFIYVLFVICMIVIVLDGISKFDDKILVLAGLLFVIIYLVLLPDEVLAKKILQNLLPFVAGILIYDHLEILDNVIINVASGIASVVICILCYIFETQHFIHILDVAHSIIVPYTLFSAFFHCSHYKFAVLSKLGRESLYLYIIHPIAINLTRMIFIRIGMDNIIIWLVGLLVSGIGVPYVISLIAKRLAIIEILFKPRKYIEACRKR